MLSISATKQIIGDNISDTQAAVIRDVCYAFAELAIDSWYEKQYRDKKNENA